MIPATVLDKVSDACTGVLLDARPLQGTRTDTRLVDTRVVDIITAAFTRWCSLRVVGALMLAAWVYFLVPGPFINASSASMPHAIHNDITDPDIWWHLRNAAGFWQTHAWLHRDAYSFTAAGAPWINHEWLAEIPFYLAWRSAGPLGLYLVTLFTIECILVGLYWLTCAHSENYPASSPMSLPAAAFLTTAIASVLATVSFGPRTLLFGWACLVLQLMLLQHFASQPSVARNWRNPVITLPLLFCLWINLHGSWLIGLVLLIVFIGCGWLQLHRGSIANPAWTGAQKQALCIALLLSMGALFINPYGWRLVLYPFDMAFLQPLNIATIEEWKPLDLHSARGLIFLLSLGTLAGAQLLRRRRWALWELTFAAIGIYAACRHVRFLFLGALLVMPLLGRQLAHLFSQPFQTKPIIARDQRETLQTATHRAICNATLIAATLALTIFSTFSSHSQTGRTNIPPDEPFPVAALAKLQAFPFNGRVFNEYQWGGYLAYNLSSVPVFIDSRMDIYERNGTLRTYLDIIHLRNSLALLDQYRIRYVLFEKDTPLVLLLEQTHAWTADYDDGKVVLLERLESQTPVAVQ